MQALGYVLLTHVVEEADGQYAAYCPELDVATCGDTIEEAFANLEDAVVVHLDALEEVGTREEVFNARHIEVHPPTETEVKTPIKVSKTVHQFIPAVV